MQFSVRCFGNSQFLSSLAGRITAKSFAFAVAFASLAFVSMPAMAQENEAPAGGGSQNMLVKTWDALGAMYSVIFLIMSIILVALVVRAILAAQKSNFVPDDLVQGVDVSLEEKNAQAAVDLVQADDSFLGTVLAAGLGKLQKGREAAFEAMQVTGEAEIMKVEHLLGYLALIGNIAPMVGLLGTVQGMVESFGQIASSASTPKPSQLAGGIEKALYTTLVGLVLAIPAIAIFNILRNKVQRHVLAAGVQSEEMLEKFEPFVGK